MKLDSAFLEQVRNVPVTRLKEPDFFKVFTNCVTRHPVSKFIEEQELFNGCYDILEDNLSFIKSYYDYGYPPIYKGEAIDDAEVELTASFMHCLKNKMDKASTLSEMLPALIGFNFLKIDYQEEIDQGAFSELYLSVIKKEVHDLLSTFTINPTAVADSSYSDRQIARLIQTESEKKDIKKIYKFIRAAERGMGLPVPFVFSLLVTFMYDLDFESFIKVLNNKEGALEIACLLKQLEPPAREQLVRIAEVKNKWCLYELIRQVLDDIRGEKIDDIADSLYWDISRALSKLAVADSEFFEHIIISHKMNLHFSKVLALSLGALDKQYSDIYLKIIKLSKFGTNMEIGELFISTFHEHGDKDNLYHLCEGLLLKWHQLLQTMLKEQDYIGGIVYTDYYQGVLTYMDMEYDEQRMFTEIQQTMQEIDQFKYSWKKNSIDDRNHYYVGLTKFYTLAIIFDHKSLQLTEHQNLKQEIEAYVQDRISWLRYFKEIEMPEAILKIKELYGV